MCVSVRGRVVETTAAEPSLVKPRSPRGSSGGRGDFDVSAGEADRSAEQPDGGRHLALLGDAITAPVVSFSHDGALFQSSGFEV